jgi:hypothetical protein
MSKSKFGKFVVPALAAGAVLAATGIAVASTTIEGTKITQTLGSNGYSANIGNTAVNGGKSTIRLAKGRRGYTDPGG